MAFFGGGSSKEENKATVAPSNQKKSNSNINTATIITTGTEVSGTIKGNDSVHIDGVVKGDVIVNNMVVIGKSGIVDGSIRAQRVMISGQLDGSIVCDDLEVLQTGKVRDEINAAVIILDGEVEGDIVAERSINVTLNGRVKAQRIMSQKVLVDGTIHGEVVATEILEIGPKGYVEGNITVKNIKTHEGGRIIGSMATYIEAIKETVTIPKEEATEVDSKTAATDSKTDEFSFDTPK
jgi:cytoskeletal protein CcmA (bactofilin family)